MEGRRFIIVLLAIAVRAGASDPVVVLPNADGVLDLAGAIQARGFDATPNPFRERYRPEPKIRELSLAITAVLVARKPGSSSAIVNGRVCSAGDDFEGLKISAISADALVLRDGDILVRVPVGDPAPRLRLPR